MNDKFNLSRMNKKSNLYYTSNVGYKNSTRPVPNKFKSLKSNIINNIKKSCEKNGVLIREDKYNENLIVDVSNYERDFDIIEKSLERMKAFKTIKDDSYSIYYFITPDNIIELRFDYNNLSVWNIYINLLYGYGDEYYTSIFLKRFLLRLKCPCFINTLRDTIVIQNYNIQCFKKNMITCEKFKTYLDGYINLSNAMEELFRSEVISNDNNIVGNYQQYSIKFSIDVISDVKGLQNLIKINAKIDKKKYDQPVVRFYN